MFKKLSASVLALALVAGVFAPAQAQDLIGLYFADPVDGLQRHGITPVGPFDIVVQTMTDETACASEFVMTEIAVVVPGVFKTNTAKIFNTPLDLGDNNAGEYILAYGPVCAAPGPVEVVRVSYLDFNGLMPLDVILQIRGFQPGDSQPSSFLGGMGYIDTTSAKHGLLPEPWPGIDQTNIDPTKGPNGVASGDGVCVLNADSTPNESVSVTSLKARF